jgi:predicted metal-dependent hydrolase
MAEGLLNTRSERTKRVELADLSLSRAQCLAKTNITFAERVANVSE